MTDFVSTGYIYDKSTVGNGDENVNYKLSKWNTKVKEMSRIPLGNGYENLRCVLQISTDLLRNEEGSYTSCTSFGNNLYDYHTGVKLKARSTSGNDGFSYVTPIMFHDKQYNISYTANVSWDYSDWCYEEWDDSYWSIATGTVVIEVKAPAGYDGLVFGVSPKTQYESSNYDDPASDQISYAPTNPKEGSVFYRINP